MEEAKVVGVKIVLFSVELDCNYHLALSLNWQVVQIKQ
jgi:hypothetical protein